MVLAGWGSVCGTVSVLQQVHVELKRPSQGVVTWRRTRKFSFNGGNQLSPTTGTQQYNLRKAGHRIPVLPVEQVGQQRNFPLREHQQLLRARSEPTPCWGLGSCLQLRRLMAFVSASHTFRLAAQQAALRSTNVADSTLLSYPQPRSAVSSKSWREIQAINFKDL